MTMLDLANVLVATAILGVGGVLWWTLRILRPWRRALVAHAPSAVSGPLSCVASELSRLPWVFATSAASRISMLFDNELVTASLTGLAAAVAGVTFWHFLRAALCVRHAVKGGE